MSQGAGDEVEADISQPGGAELSDQRRGEAPRLWTLGKFGSGYAGLRDFRATDTLVGQRSGPRLRWLPLLPEKQETPGFLCGPFDPGNSGLSCLCT